MCFRNGASETVARRKFPQGNVKNFVTLMLALSVAFFGAFLAGCSGGSQSGHTGVIATPTPAPTATPATPVTVKASIAWGARSRSTTTSGFAAGPSSALSAVITLKAAGTDGSDLKATANRDVTQVAGYTGTYTLATAQAYPGKVFALHIDFYSQANAGGSLVATADTPISAPALVKTDGTLNVLVTTTGTIATVAVADVAINGVNQNGQITLSATGTPVTADVVYSAYDSSGRLLAITPGSGFVTVTPGITAITAAGDRVTATVPTTSASFTISVDGIESPAFTLKVVSSAGITLAATIPTSTNGNPTDPTGTPGAPITSPGNPVNVTATVAGDPTNAGVTFTLQEGAIAGTLANVTPTSVQFVPTSVIPTAPVTYHLVATSKYDANITTTLPIVVESLVSVHVTLPGSTALLTSSSVVTVPLAGTQQFNAATYLVPTASDMGVTFSIVDASGNPVTNGGSISTSGLYTAPSTVATPAGTQFHIRVTSNFDTSKYLDFVVLVESIAQVAITGPTTIAEKQVQTYTAQVTSKVTGLNIPAGQSQDVIWTAPDGGTLGTPTFNSTTNVATQTFTAPATTGTFRLVATSKYDPTASATTTITVVSVAKVVVNGPTPIAVKDTEDYTAQVISTVAGVGIPTGQSQDVTWTAPKGGTLGTPVFNTTTNVSTIPFTAPATPGTYTLVATSKYDPTMTATYTIVVESVAQIAIAGPTSLAVKAVGTYTAAVSSKVSGIPIPTGQSLDVTWTAPDGGTLGTPTFSSATNLSTISFTAPATPGTYRLIATSNYDTTVAKTYTITVLTVAQITIAGPATLAIDGVGSYTATVNSKVAGIGIPTGQSLDVTWTAPDGGTLGAPNFNGTTSTISYTAPAAIGAYRLVATSKYDTSVSTTYTIQVIHVALVTVAGPTTLAVKEVGTFAAQVTSKVAGVAIPASQSLDVTWTAPDGGTLGTPTYSPITNLSVISYTAPATVGTYRLIATSKYDPTATTTYTVNVISIAQITITGPNRVSTNSVNLYTAVVSSKVPGINIPSGQSLDVIWQAPDGGTLGATTYDGVKSTLSWTAPPLAGTYRLVATSKYDPTVSQTYTVTVIAGSITVIVN